MEHLVKGLKIDNQELQKHCASAIFKVSSSNNRSNFSFIPYLTLAHTYNTCVSNIRNSVCNIEPSVNNNTCIRMVSVCIFTYSVHVAVDVCMYRISLNSSHAFYSFRCSIQRRAIFKGVLYFL